ncbi:MAG: SDR family oxidoreductase [Rhodospirillaceae bacterium]|nr:SDR family oxidoreductase [Rhodospirillaceae bacterium]
MFDLTGKAAVITGSSKGIGKGIAEQMAAHGANVVISSRTQADCEAVAEAINTTQNRDAATAVACDISNDDDLINLVDEAMGRWGRLDSLVCNALVQPTGTDIAAQRKAADTNIWSTVQLCQLAKPHLAQSDRASIVIIGSIAGLAQPCDLDGLWYSMSKVALVKLVIDLATEWAPDNITVNCVSPGLTRSHLTESIFFSTPELTQRVSAVIPLGRPGVPQEIAGQVVLCASDAGAFMTGQTIAINGGYMTCHPDLLGQVFAEMASR